MRARLIKIGVVGLVILGLMMSSMPFNSVSRAYSEEPAPTPSNTVTAGITDTETGTVTVASGNTWYVPDNYSTIQAAVDAASPGDTIIVRDGTYTENINVNKSLTIESEKGADLTIVHAADPNDDVVEVTANNVTISGFTVKGAIRPPDVVGRLRSGIYLGGVSDCDITNNIASNNDYGIYLEGTHNNGIAFNTLSNNDYGIRFDHGSSYNSINNNKASNNATGIEILSESNNNTLRNNIVSDNGMGIMVLGSPNNTFIGNEISSNGDGMWLNGSPSTLISNAISANSGYNFSTDGVDVVALSHTIDTTNTVNGKPIYYLVGKKDVVIDSSWGGIGYLGIVNSTNITVEDITLGERNGEGMLLAFCNDSRIEKIQVSNSRDGIAIYEGSNNTVINCTVSNSFDSAIHLWDSSYNNVTNNNVSNSRVGILLYNSSNNTVVNNTVLDNYDNGISLSEKTHDNILYNNKVLDNSCGVFLYATEYMSPKDNIIYLNNFINNADAVCWCLPPGKSPSEYTVGIWNSSEEITYNGKTYTSYLGNYWSDYSGSDVNPKDGIGDTPYSIDGDNDNYPLMQPFENYVEGEIPPENQPPVAKFTYYPENPVVNEEITFNASDSYDSDGYIECYAWSFYYCDSEECFCEASSWKVTTFSYSGAGDYAVKLTVFDNNQAGDSMIKVITVSPVPENRPPTCAIKLQKNGVEISEVDIGDFFDIYVGGSTDDTGIKEVRFLSDESQNEEVDEGFTWTDWYNWDISSEDWDASSKIKRWAFATTGTKEVWVEVRDDAGQSAKCSANISAWEEAPILGKLINIRGIPGDFTFENNLSYGMENNEVRYLQIMLAEEGPEVYPESLVTGKFYSLTKSAVIKFQEKYADEILTPLGLTSGNGYVGSATREKLNKLLERYREVLKEEDRISAIFNAVQDNYKSFSIGDFPIELILAVTSQETGARYNFNNELIGGDDVGRGIMQITTRDFVGAGSGVNCGDGTSCYSCKERIGEDWKEKCYEYYSNTFQGIEANIKDGLYGLKEKYSYTKKHYDLCMQGDNDWSRCNDYGISCEEMRWISAVQRYHTYKKYGWQDSKEYLKNIAEKLRDLINWFPEVDSTRASNLAIDVETVWSKSKWIKIFSSGYLRIYDSQKRITGLVKSEVKEDIPNSIYDPENEAVSIFFPDDDYDYEVIGIETGTYGLDITSIKEGEVIIFTAIDIPTTPDQVHQYTIDWDALSRDEKGVTLQIDVDGDGEPEKTVTADNDLTYDEFILQTETVIDIDPDTLNLKSRGQWITAYIELPEGYDVTLIDATTVSLTVSLDEILAVTDPKYDFVTDSSQYLVDHDEDGILERMVKFDRSEVQDLFSRPEDAAILLVTGKVSYNSDYPDFAGSDIIKVIDKGDTHQSPNPASVVE